MSEINYDQWSAWSSSRAANRLDELVGIQKAEREAINEIFKISQKIEELEQLIPRWSQQEARILFDCNKALQKIQTEKVSILEYKEMHVKTAAKIKELINLSENRIPDLMVSLAAEDARLVAERKRENEEAVSKFVTGIIKVFAYSFSFIAGGTLLLVLLILIAAAVIIARCHGS